MDILAYDYEILSIFIFEEVIGIALFKVIMLGNLSRNFHKNYSNIMHCLLTMLLPGMETVHCLLQKVIGITHISYDI